MRYLRHGVVRFFVNVFWYPIAGYILATTTYVAFDTYLRDLLVINTKYYSALIVFLGVWTVWSITSFRRIIMNRTVPAWF